MENNKSLTHQVVVTFGFPNKCDVTTQISVMWVNYVVTLEFELLATSFATSMDKAILWLGNRFSLTFPNFVLNTGTQS
jgi:hypothetical protein